MFWIGSFDAIGTSAKVAVTDTLNKTHTPAQNLVASVETAFQELRKSLFGPKKIEYKSIEVLPGN